MGSRAGKWGFLSEGLRRRRAGAYLVRVLVAEELEVGFLGLAHVVSAVQADVKDADCWGRGHECGPMLILSDAYRWRQYEKGWFAR